jgi:hypothetical protein
MPEYPLVPFVAGRDLTADSVNLAFNIERYAITLLDQSVLNSATLVNSTYLFLSVAAKAVYVLRSLVIYDANATADIKFQFTLPSGTFIRTAAWLSGTGAAATDATIFHQCADSGAWTAGGIAAGTYMSAKTVGAIFIGGTGGNCQLQFAQNTANNVNATVLKSGSFLYLRRVA